MMPRFVFQFWRYEQQRQKTYLRTCAPSEDSDQPAQDRHWAHFSWPMMFTRATKTLIRLTDAQADLSLRWAHISEGTFANIVLK